MLLFKRKFLDAIRRGEKTQTIRLWKFRRMAPGQRSYIPGVGYIRIESVDEIQLADLTDDDARPDGFPTAVALRAEIAAIYARSPQGSQRAYRIRFTRIEPNGDKLTSPPPAIPRRKAALPAQGYPLVQSRNN